MCFTDPRSFSLVCGVKLLAVVCKHPQIDARAGVSVQFRFEVGGALTKLLLNVTEERKQLFSLFRAFQVKEKLCSFSQCVYYIKLCKMYTIFVA